MKLAVDNIQNWMYVTGVPRSGTTFIGKILSLPLSVDFINEPFSASSVAPEPNFKYRYLRPDDTSELAQSYAGAFDRMRRYDFDLETWCPTDDPWHRKVIKRIVGSRGPFYLRLAKLNPFHKHTVVKEPKNGLIAGYLYEHFPIRPIIVVRHPLSLAASLSRVSWSPRIDWFAAQPTIVEDYFSHEPGAVNNQPADSLEAAARHWRIVYDVLLTQAAQHPDWIVVVLEEFSKTPTESARRLYHQLNLPWSSAVERRISKYTQANSAEARNNRVHDLKRDSASIFKLRRESISPRARARIFDVVRDVALQVYSVDSFGLHQPDHA